MHALSASTLIRPIAAYACKNFTNGSNASFGSTWTGSSAYASSIVYASAALRARARTSACRPSSRPTLARSKTSSTPLTPSPPSSCLMRWREMRGRQAQTEMELRSSAHQLQPTYCQVYFDDGAGAGIDDPVPTPELVSHISIDPPARPSTALGGRFSPADARVIVHVLSSCSSCR